MQKLFAVIFLFSLFSCKKNSDTKSKAKTRYDLLINKKWKLSAESGYTTGGVFVPDAYSSLPDWAKDDYFYFYSDLSYELNAGPLKESASDPQIQDHGTWQLTTSDQFISLVSLVPGTTSNPIKIIELTDTKLSGEEVEPFSGNKVTYSFIAIPWSKVNITLKKLTLHITDDNEIIKNLNIEVNKLITLLKTDMEKKRDF